MFFPEFQGLPSSVTNLDMKVEGARRLTAYGCQDGSLRCFLVDISAGGMFVTCLMATCLAVVYGLFSRDYSILD